jgi:signal transduction histidine kinase
MTAKPNNAMQRSRRAQLLLWLALCIGAAVLLNTANAKSNEEAVEQASGDRITLAPRERQWLTEHNGMIRIGITVIPPQILADGAGYKGLSIDYIRLLERKLGVRFKLVPYATWNQVIQAAKERRIDMIFAAQQTPERLQYLLFTEPYIELPNIIIVRKDRVGGTDLSEMNGWSVATSKGSAVQEYLKENFPDLVLRPVADELAGLRMVSLGEADAMVVEVSRASYYIEKAGILNLRVAGDAGLLYQLRFAVRKDWPELRTILDRALASVTSEERREISRRWIIVGKRGIFANKALLNGLLIALVIVAAVLIGVFAWNRALRRVVRQRTEQLQQELGERKRAEEKIRDLYQELEQRVADRTAKLAAANKELEDISYSVSHDLRAPLRAIDGFSHIVLEDYGDKLDDEGKRMLQVVRDNASRMGQLIDGILEFLRIYRQEMMFSTIDMEKLAHSVVDTLQPAGGKPQIEIAPLPPCIGDRAMLRQVWVNLLSNAIKFRRTDKLLMIKVGATVKDGETVYYVKDNGVGFDMQYADKLFGVFQRLHGAIEFEGTGIGLAIVKRIVTRHGGRIWAEGKVNQGATIYFALPSREKMHE